MDGGGRSQSQDKTQHTSSHQKVTGATGTGVDPMTAQGITNKLQLQSRSPFVSSLGESDLKQQHAAQSANSGVLQRQAMPQVNQPRSPLAPYSMPTAMHGHLPPNTAGDTLSSRGVLSLHSSGPQSHDSSRSSFTSGLSSYNGSSSVEPLVYHSILQPQGATGEYPGHYTQMSAGGSRYNASGGYMAPSNVGSRSQGPGSIHPHMSHYQPLPYSAAPSSVAYSSSERVVPQDYPYHSQLQQQQQAMYSTHHSLHYGQPQAQTYDYQTQSVSGAPPANHYGYNTPIDAQQYEPGYTAPAPTPAYYHSPYSSSFASGVPSTPYQYLHHSLAPSSVPYSAQNGSQPLSASQRYTGPRNEYAPASIPYHPLQSYSSVSSSDWNSRPSNGYPTHQYPPVVHPVFTPPHSPPQPQGQLPQGASHQPVHQTQCSHYEPSSHAQFSSNFTPSLVQRPTPQHSKGAYYQAVHESDGDEDRPQGADVAGVSGQLGGYGGSSAGGEIGLVQGFEKLKLQSQTQGDKSSSGKQPLNSECGSYQTANYSWSNDDDSERTCSSFISGGLGSRQEELEDKTGFLPKRSIEFLEQPRDSTVGLSGTLKLTCRARIIGSKLEEEPDYLWYKDGEPLVGEISGECVVENVGEGDGGRYFCLVSHPDDQRTSLKSQIAVVTIRTSGDTRAPVLTHQPEAYVEAVKGEPLVLTVVAEGEGPLRYKWFKGTQELQYCGGNVVRVTASSSLDSGQYCCTVSNDYGSVLSDVVLVKVVLQRTIPPPRSSPSRKRYSSNPDDEIPNDRTLRWLAGPVARQTKNWARLVLYLGLMPADVADTQHYQASAEQKAYHLLREWRERKHGTLYALKTILSQAGISLQEPSTTSPCPSPTPTLSSSSQLPSLSISSHPQDVIVVYGQEAKLEVRTEGLTQTCSYQWYKDGCKLLAKTEKSMVIASTVDSDEGSYSCQISNPEGSIMSHPAAITVVSVAPQSSSHQPRDRRAVERRNHPTHLPLPPGNINRGGGAVYGLTGRGVDDDDDNDESLSEPYRMAVPSIPPSTMPQKATTGTITITEQPRSHVTPLGSAVTLTCKVSLSGGGSHDDLNYVWYLNGLSLLEHTSPQYHIASCSEEDEGMYSCQVSTLNESVMSQMASVSVVK